MISTVCDVCQHRWESPTDGVTRECPSCGKSWFSCTPDRRICRSTLTHLNGHPVGASDFCRLRPRPQEKVMTPQDQPNDLDRARAEEAARRVAMRSPALDIPSLIKAVAEETAVLARTNWQPPIDPDILAVREFMAGRTGDEYEAEMERAGEYDNCADNILALAAFKHAKSIGKDAG